MIHGILLDEVLQWYFIGALADTFIHVLSLSYKWHIHKYQQSISGIMLVMIT